MYNILCKQKNPTLLWIIFNAVTIHLWCNLPFSNEDKALVNNLYQFKKYNLWRIVSKFLKINCKRDFVTKGFEKQ